MNKTLIILLVIAIMAVLVTACQATPDEPVVIQKDMEQMIEAVKSNADKKTLCEMLNASDRMQFSVQNANGSVTVNADAEVLVPEAEGISTLRIRKHEFTQTGADKILEYFIDDNIFNSSFEGKDDVFIEMLLRFKAELAAETDPQKKAELQASIEKCEKAGIKVSDGPQEIAPASKVFEENPLGGQSIQGYSQTQDGNRFLQIVNNSEMNEYRVLYTYEQAGFADVHGTYWEESERNDMSKIGLDPEIVSRLPLSITEEQAQETAAHALQALGLEDMTLACCSEVWGGASIGNGVLQDRHAYSLEYMRQVGGVPITYSEFGIVTGALFETNDGGYAARWPYECVHFIIDDTGIVEFIWESPYELVETITEHSAIMSFDEIQSVFTKMMLITNAYTSNESTSIAFDVTRVQLGLMRITEKDSTDTALLIPVWDFFGTYKTNDGEEEPYVNQDTNTSWLTINAIDGSIIDRSKGY